MSKLYNRVKRAGGGPGLYANIAAKKGLYYYMNRAKKEGLANLVKAL